MTFTAYNNILRTLEKGVITEIFRIKLGFDDSIFDNGEFKKKPLEYTNEFTDELSALDGYRRDFEIETEANAIESVDNTLKLCTILYSKIETPLVDLFRLIEKKDRNIEVDEVDEDYVFNVMSGIPSNFNQHKKKKGSAQKDEVVMLLFMLAYVLMGIKHSLLESQLKLINPTEHSENAVKILYLHYSGTLEFFKDKIRSQKDDHITNVHLSDTLAFLCNGKPSSFKVLLSQLSNILSKRPHIAFQKIMIEQAILQLHKDGFDTSDLESILLQMDKTN